MKRKALDTKDDEDESVDESNNKRVRPNPTEEKDKVKDKDKERERRIYISLDLETTGTDPKQDEIVQIALIKFDFDSGEQIEEWESMVKPSKPIPSDATAIHKFDDDDVKDAPKFANVAGHIHKFIGDAGLVGHNLLQFDLPLLQNELRRAKHPEIDCHSRSLLDTLVIFQKKEPHTLSRAALFYCDVEYMDAHNARDDAVACMKVCLAQKEKYSDLFNDVKQAERLCKPFEFFDEVIENNKTMDLLIKFGKHKGKRATEVRKSDRGYWNWLLNKEKQSRSKWYAKLQSI
jgi:DNA polymerase-3 subunit epsilon